ncbi:substrate-binding protein [Burkholderia multivorans]|uniref:substrate-binding protein n=1 Tax=Burkholderia multivorans TaxID=87883 RepID=UPI001C23251C|nr:substrate-binding protein [Burkholderia multivorans]MBU9372626.1 substrate-binding protein [Burkholderia multivorans]MBU9469164.1 substrate-binding protein [Burkholderia multivorans]MDR8751544.1 Aliphatic amidase expression-regulating protein [Burkholderia multivorans]MDR8810580.1 Aliphatic amidase expression-regulating protein [Burkholderia multivorans]
MMKMRNLVLSASLSLAFGATAHAADPIKIGVPVGLSGANSVLAPSVVQAAELAVEEINAKGGVLGRKLALEIADDGSGAQGAQRAYDSLVFQKKVDAIVSMENSAARNAGLPIINRGKVPMIYTSFYEGRSCSPWMFVNAWVPEQQVAPVVDQFMGKEGAKKFFLIGSDYAFGRGMLEFTRKYIQSKGGTVVGEEYLPMDGSDWTAVISKLRSANPDALITSTVGGVPNVTLTKQLRAAGIKIPYGNLALDERTAKTMGGDAEGIYISASYLSSLDNPANKKFLEAAKAKFGSKLETPNELSEPLYEGIHAYAAAVQKAGSTDAAKVVKELAKVSVQGPRGTITMNKQHHAPLTMYLGRVKGDGSVEVIKSFPNVDPGEQCPHLAD